MSLRMGTCAGWLIAAHGLLGCTFGEPLLGVTEPPMDRLPISCAPAPQCPDPPNWLSRTWDEFDSLRPLSLSQCDPPRTPSCDDEDDPACDDDLERLRLLADRPRECGDWSFNFAPENIPQGDAVRLRGLQLERVNLTLESEVPVRIVMQDVSFSQVFISLLGPVDLTVERASTFDDVRMIGRGDGEGTPRVRLSRVKEGMLRVGELHAPFDGEVVISASGLNESKISASELSVESSTLADSVLRSTTLLALDAAFVDCAIAVGEGQLAACTFEDTDVEQCGTLTVSGSELKVSRIVACDPGPLRLYANDIEASMVDGSVELVDTIIRGSRFGVAAPTRFVSWDSLITSSSMCRYAERHEISGGRVACLGCDERFAEQDSVCTSKDLSDTDWEAILSDAACEPYLRAEVCEEPTERVRPPR